MGGGNEMRRTREKGENKATKVMRVGMVIVDNRTGTKVSKGKKGWKHGGVKGSKRKK